MSSQTRPLVATTGQELVLEGDQTVALGDLEWTSLSEQDLRFLGRLIEVSTDGKNRTLARPLRRLVVGRLAFRGHTISVPPPIAPESFLTLLVTAIAPELLTKRFADQAEVATSFAPTRWSRYFEVLVAFLCLSWIEQILTSHIAQSYVRRQDRMTNIKGRIHWSSNFGSHPSEGIQCQYFSLQTDNLLNRLVLASLLKCGLVLRDTPWSSRAQTQVFIWRSLASVHIPRSGDFELAYSKMNRQTNHYLPGLRLGEALLYGHAPRDLVPQGSEWLQGMYFFMDRLYEDFLYELLKRGLEGSRISLRRQFVQGDAFVNALGNRYMQVRPDIVLFRGGEPVAVIDAKYKPAYMRGGAGAPVTNEYRLSSGDLYQMFFYEARLRYRYGVETPLRTAIVAPQLSGVEPVDRPYRSIRFNAAGEANSAVLEVLPLPLDMVLPRVRHGDFGGALSEAPEIQGFVRSLNE